MRAWIRVSVSMKRHFMFDKLHVHPSGHIYFSGLIYCFADLSTFMDALTFYKEKPFCNFLFIPFFVLRKNMIVELAYEQETMGKYYRYIHKERQIVI